MPYFYYYDPTYIILIPAIIFSLLAQASVKGNFNKYSKVRNHRNLTGMEAARKVLDANGLRDVKIQRIAGNLTDNYNPRTKTLNLSQSVCDVNSVSAISVACHEAGHAIQHAHNYIPVKVRGAIVPVVNFASTLSWPLIIIGILLLSTDEYMGDTLFTIGVLAFGAVVLFHLVTLPVEFNASRRAIKQMNELGIIDYEEEKGTKRVLRAAALTYVAALATAVANLLRILAIRGRRN